MRKLLLILFVSMFMINLVSALNWDNVGYWDFNETSGSISADKVAGIYNITRNAQIVTNSTGIIGYSVKLSDYGRGNFSSPITMGTNNFTWSMWLYADNLGQFQASGMALGTAEYNYGGVGIGSSYDTANRYSMWLGNGTSWTAVDDFKSNPVTEGKYYHVVMTRLGNNVTMWINGTAENSVLIPNNYNVGINATTTSTEILGALNWEYVFDGNIDEMSWFNRSLSADEILELYNGGAGLAYTGGGVSVSIKSPADSSVFLTTETILFNATISSSSLVNTSLYIDGVLNETKLLTGTSNTTQFSKIGFSIGNHSWFIQGCGTSICSNSSVRVFNVSSVIINSATYNATTQLGNTESFVLNVTTTGLSTVNFTYNGVIYSPSISVSGTEAIISYTLSSNVSGTKIFNWTLKATGNDTYYSSNYNQQVNIIGIDDCSTYTNTILNFTLYDEENQTIIASGSAPKIELNVNIYSTNTYPNGPVISYNKTYNYNNATICLNESILISSTYYMDVQIRYSASGYSSEFYNIQKYTFTNATALQHIKLFDLLTADSTPFTITFKDKNFIVVKDALVIIQRKYVSENAFKTVEIPKTDIYGKAIVHLDTNGVIYTISFVKNGVLMATFDSVSVQCTDYYQLNCPINLNQEQSNIIIPDFNINNNIYSSMSFNSSTRTISVGFSSADGSSNTIKLIANKSDMFSNTTVCTTSLTSSSGNFNCIVPSSYGNITVRACLYSNNVQLYCNLFSIHPDSRQVFGNDGYFLVLLILITIPLLFITSYIGMVIGVIVGLILCGLLMIYSGDAWFGMASSLIWAIVAGFIIIWKINQRGQS